MRVLVLALLLANILFFGWQYWLGEHEPPMPADPYRDVPELELASMPAPVSDLPSAVEGAAGIVADDAVSAGACATLGPFADKAQAETTIAGSGLSEFQPVLREVAGVRTTYWVYLPPFRDRQSANRALRTLSDIGIRDAYVVGDGEDRNAIALGLYSDQDRATRRADQIQALGVTAQIGPLKRAISLYMIDLVLPSRSVLDAVQIATLGPGVSLVEINCDAPAEGLTDE